MGWVGAQVLPRCRQLDRILVVVRFANKVVQKLRTFVPPMSKELGVVRRKQVWRAIHNFSQLLNLFDAHLHEVLRMLGGRVQGGRTVVNFLFRSVARNGMIFDTCKGASAADG